MLPVNEQFEEEILLGFRGDWRRDGVRDPELATGKCGDKTVAYLSGGREEREGAGGAPVFGECFDVELRVERYGYAVVFWHFGSCCLWGGCWWVSG